MDRPRAVRRIDEALPLGGDPGFLARLSRVCADELEVGGAGISLFVRDLPWGPSGSSDPVAARIEDLQLTLGEGPCADAHRSGRPVAEPDLRNPRRVRWPALTEPALAAGAAALFAFPLRVGAAHLGALTLHRTAPGSLSAADHADGHAMAELMAAAVLAVRVPAADGGPDAAPELLADYRPSLHQAAGMVSAQLEIDIVAAMVRLRAHAYASGRPLAEVSDDVVARRLRLDDDGPPP